MALPPSAPGFFRAGLTSRATEDVAGQRLQLVDVGGNGDCGFRAVAAAFLDNCDTHNWLDGALVSRVLENYFKHFPMHQDNAVTSPRVLDRMRRVMQQIDRYELIGELAYTFRQMAVDALLANPVTYRGAFVDLDEGTSPHAMRQPGAWIDESSMAALAEALTVPIEVQVVNRTHDIPLKLRYNATVENQVSNPKIIVQLKDKHYRPWLSAGVRVQLNVSRTYPAPVLPEASDIDLDAILQQIAKEDELLANKFINTRSKLQELVGDGLLTKSILLEIYCSAMAQSDYLQGRVAQVGIEHGHQAFFEKAIDRARPLRQGDASPEDALPGTHEEELVSELVHALARAVSIGHLRMSDIQSVLSERESARRLTMRSS